MIVRVTDGTTTVTLNSDSGSASTGLHGARYFPQAGDGETAQDIIDVVFNGHPDTLLALTQSLRRMFARAAMAPPGIAMVWIEYRPRDEGDNSDMWRSPIRSGNVVWSDDRNLRQMHGTVTVGELQVIIDRADWWEGDVESNDFNGLKNGTGTPYYNVAYFTAGPTGDLPTPIKVEIENTNGDDVLARNFYISIDSFAGLSTNQHQLTDGAGSSSWDPSSAHNSLRWVMEIPEDTVTALAGQSVNVVAAFSSLSDNIYLRAGVWAEVDATIFTAYEPVNLGGEKFTSDRLLLNLGTVQIPALITGNLYLIITAYSAVAGAGTLLFAQLSPAAGTVHLQTGDWADGDLIVYDGANRVAYYDTGSAKWATVKSGGGPLMAWPGMTRRLHILFDEASAYTPSRTFDVVISARPRRRAV